MMAEFFSSTKKRGTVDNNAPVFIIAGQSNTGWPLASSLSAELQAPIAGTRIHNYTNNVLEPIVAGTNTNFASRFGPEVNLGKLLYDYRQTLQYFIKYGVGGTYLAADAAQDWNVSSTNELLANLKTRITAGRTSILASGKTPVYKAFIWMQGEEDATNLTYANAYQANLEAFISNIRTFLGVPTLPFIIGRINGASDPIEVHRLIVRAAQNTVGAQANNYLINTDGYPLMDVVHYNHNGQLQFGQDIFNIVKNF